MPALLELDFDLAYLARFDVDAILEDRLELLHHEERVDWAESWHEELATPLWRFNLHYHEYLLPLAKAYIDTGDARYIDKAKSIVTSWVESCPLEAGADAWHPYVISLRVVNWLAFRAELDDMLASDSDFCDTMDRSLAEQYVYLSQHLEADLLANHYLENLKALAIMGCYFQDDETLELVLPRLKEQIAEQVLPDGMHFELSPMYHKIVLEDLIRVASTLHASGYRQDWSKAYRLQDMSDALWTLEGGVDRTPLFNDSGDNVAKSRDALLACARERFGIVPYAKTSLPDAGYVIMERDIDAGHVKLVMDVGRPSPTYAMGHAHCDALSFECFVDSHPWIVNSGTYAYQDGLRPYFRSTAAHNTVAVGGREQLECWDEHRVARSYRRAWLVEADAHHLIACMETMSGAIVERQLTIGEAGLTVCDAVAKASVDRLDSFVHLHPDFAIAITAEAGVLVYEEYAYAPEFGILDLAQMAIVTGEGAVRYTLHLQQGAVS